MKTAAEVQELISKGEGIELELKSAVDLDTLRSVIVAFANDYAEIGGGTIIVGVDKNGKLVGVSDDPDTVQQRIANITRDGSTEPPLAPTIYVQQIEGKSVVVIDVQHGTRRPYLAKGNCYIRVGSTTRRASFEDMLELRRRCEVEPGETRRIVHSLPARETIVVRFTGRRNELEALRQWIRDPAARRWALAGAGGKGKTAIAYQFASEINELAIEPFEMIVWMSAKRRRFEEGIISPIETPDFYDLESALDKILCDYGYIDMVGADTATKKEEVIQLLTHLPALLVVDDVDSLEACNEDAIDFLAHAVERIPSRLLVTSRHQLYPWGHITTLVQGFDERDGAEFIKSRVELFGLDSDPFKAKRVRRIIQVTEGSPLYIEDLLRLSIVEPLDSAIKRWATDPGDKAREFALGREFEELSSEAKEVLLVCSLNEGPISLAEVKTITGFAHEKLAGAVRELHRLFLVPTPRYIRGVERFDVNVNTRLLVRKLMADSDAFRRTIGALESLSGERGASLAHRRKVGGYIRQAVFLAKERRYEEGEATLEESLRQHPNDPDLLGQLGWLYKNWKPRPRVTDARKCFRRSAQLKCQTEDMYRHWALMECEESEWTKAAEAAEKGLKILSESDSLRQIAGYACNMLGRELLEELHPDRARTELMRGKAHLERVLVSSKGAELSENDVRASAYRGIVLIIETLIRCEQNMVWTISKERDKAITSLLRELSIYLKGWAKEYPHDPRCSLERDRLFSRFPQLGRLRS